MCESLNNNKQTLEQLRRMFNEALDGLSNENGKTKVQRNSEADAGVRYSKKTDSSIKEQIESNRDLLNSMDPVAVINEYPRFNSGDDVRKWVVAQFKKLDLRLKDRDLVVSFWMISAFRMRCVILEHKKKGWRLLLFRMLSKEAFSLMDTITIKAEDKKQVKVVSSRGRQTPTAAIRSPGRA